MKDIHYKPEKKSINITYQLHPHISSPKTLNT